MGADWVAVDAVLSEPGSARYSLLTGKITGNFGNKGLRSDFSTENVAQRQWVAAKFPARRNREINLDNRELACQYQGTNS